MSGGTCMRCYRSGGPWIYAGGKVCPWCAADDEAMKDGVVAHRKRHEDRSSGAQQFTEVAIGRWWDTYNAHHLAIPRGRIATMVHDECAAFAEFAHGFMPPGVVMHDAEWARAEVRRSEGR